MGEENDEGRGEKCRRRKQRGKDDGEELKQAQTGEQDRTDKRKTTKCPKVEGQPETVSINWLRFQNKHKLKQNQIKN